MNWKSHINNVIPPEKVFIYMDSYGRANLRESLPNRYAQFVSNDRGSKVQDYAENPNGI